MSFTKDITITKINRKINVIVSKICVLLADYIDCMMSQIIMAGYPLITLIYNFMLVSVSSQESPLTSFAKTQLLHKKNKERKFT